MHSKLSFTAHHIRRTYFQTENKYLILFQFEKKDSTMVKEHKKKKKKIWQTRASVFSQGHFNWAKPGKFKTDKNIEKIYIYFTWLVLRLWNTLLLTEITEALQDLKHNHWMKIIYGLIFWKYHASEHKFFSKQYW